MTYTSRQFKRKLVCDACGANADVQLVSDMRDPETGYQDVIQVCRRCFDVREMEGEK